ncbi:MAG: hypothetical protein GY814_04555 [Gammaproteobacteria bacterium]|nr:hypothetical protein [Gammaproteobacteria bacterium]
MFVQVLCYLVILLYGTPHHCLMACIPIPIPVPDIAESSSYAWAGSSNASINYLRLKTAEEWVSLCVADTNNTKKEVSNWGLLVTVVLQRMGR